MSRCPSIAWEQTYANHQCYLIFAFWLEAWLYIYLENFETRCLKSNARKCFPPLCNCSVAWRCRSFARHDWHVCVIPHWLWTREMCESLKRSIWCCPNDPPKSSPIMFFEELNARSKTWFDQRTSDSKTSLYRLKDQYPTICAITDHLMNVARKIKFVPSQRKRRNFASNPISYDAFDSRGVRVESRLIWFHPRD